MKTLEERFFEKVAPPHPVTGCWIWLGARRGRGEVYGAMNVESKPKLAHRVAFESFYHEITKGLQLDHVCLNTLCVNPTHLRTVTRKENILLGNSLPARHARSTHCVHGHEFNELNTRRKDGHRVCRECHRIDELERYHSKRRA